MKQMLKKIVFFGNERLATGVSTSAATLQKLLDNGYEIAAVVANYETAQSRVSRKLEIAELAAEYGIPLLTPDNPLDIADKLRNYGAAAGVLVAYGRVVPPQILELFPQGIVNIHPSLLPERRGSTPIEQAILDGTEETGVSLMHLVEKMDAGPILCQQKVSLNGHETKQQLADQLLKIGGEMLLDMLPSIFDGSAKATVQDETEATYSSIIAKADGTIDWHKPALQIEREIRAFAGWPRSRTKLGDYGLIISGVRVIDSSGKAGSHVASKDTLTVYCGMQALEILLLQPAGKKEMPIRAFLSGYKL